MIIARNFGLIQLPAKCWAKKPVSIPQARGEIFNTRGKKMAIGEEEAILLIPLWRRIGVEKGVFR
jgi:hypothetical protein